MPGWWRADFASLPPRLVSGVVKGRCGAYSLTDVLQAKAPVAVLEGVAVPGRSVALPGIATVPALACVKTRGAAVAGSACVLHGRLERGVWAAGALLGIAAALARRVRQAHCAAAQAAPVTFR